ncbi:ABC transporter permease [Rhizosphaericola mali]|nr:ABC transporter permease [Rhizosphaericola mali]
MFIHYLRTAWRSLKANKFYSILNIVGLAVGIATSIMLLLWVQNQLSYDRFNKKYENIYEINAHIYTGNTSFPWQGAPAPVSILSKNIPEVLSYVRLAEQEDKDNSLLSNSTGTKVFDNNKIVYADTNFFHVFDYEILEGNSHAVLSNINSVVITQSTAKKLFGSVDALGKTLLFDKQNFTVSAIIKDFPSNSSLKYDAIFSLFYYAKRFTDRGGNNQWNTIDDDVDDYSFRTFLLLQSGVSPSIVADKLTLQFHQLFKNAKNEQSPTKFQLQSLKDEHLIRIDGNTTALQMVKIMGLVAIFILIIAGINYINLSTARSMTQVKNVSIRKIVGAKKGQLFLQFVIETLLTFLFAITISIVLIILLKPLYDKVTGEQLSFSLLDFSTVEILFFAILVTFLISSIYPALILSSFKPLSLLREKRVLGLNKATFRKVLVTLQFGVSFLLLVGTIIMSKQMSFIRNKDLGYDKSYVFTVTFPDEASKNADAIVNNLLSQKSILNASFTYTKDITNVSDVSGDIVWAGKKDSTPFMLWRVYADKNFIPTMKYKLVYGSNFSGSPSDEYKYILNETAVQKMGLKPPYVGTKIGYDNLEGEIAGVVKDFNFKSLKEPIAPLVIRSRDFKNVLYVRTTGADARNAIQTVENQFKRFDRDNAPFIYNFIDKTFDAHYQSQQQTGILFAIFACIAIFISCLGLFGLATYTAQIKTKEIGVRKVLGASVGNIIKMVSKDFLRLVLIAVIISTPLAYWVMTQWLSDFAYKTNISSLVFLGAAFFVMVIAFGTIGFNALKAAVANPVNSLRSE